MSKKDVFKKVIFLFLLVVSITAYADTLQKPCAVKECPLPANFDWLIACCSRSVADRDKYITGFQQLEHDRQVQFYKTNELFREGLITYETAKKANDYFNWQYQVITTHQVKDWNIPEIQARQNVVLAAINYDGKIAEICKLAPYVIGWLLTSIVAIIAWFILAK